MLLIEKVNSTHVLGISLHFDNKGFWHNWNQPTSLASDKKRTLIMKCNIRTHYSNICVHKLFPILSLLPQLLHWNIQTFFPQFLHLSKKLFLCSNKCTFKLFPILFSLPQLLPTPQCFNGWSWNIYEFDFNATNFVYKRSFKMKICVIFRCKVIITILTNYSLDHHSSFFTGLPLFHYLGREIIMFLMVLNFQFLHYLQWTQLPQNLAHHLHFYGYINLIFIMIRCI